MSSYMLISCVGHTKGIVRKGISLHLQGNAASATEQSSGLAAFCTGSFHRHCLKKKRSLEWANSSFKSTHREVQDEILALLK